MVFIGRKLRETGEIIVFSASARDLAGLVVRFQERTLTLGLGGV